MSTDSAKNDSHHNPVALHGVICAPMATFRLWSRCIEVAPGQYLCTVVAIPDDEAMHAESESHVVRTPEEAQRTLSAMLDGFERQLLTRGYAVAARESV